MKDNVELFALKVRLVMVARLKVLLLNPWIVQVPLPILSARTPVPLPSNARESVTLLLFALKSKTPVNAPIVMDCTVTVVLTVQVPPSGAESASNVTVSADPGTDAPPTPPVEADQ